MRCSRRPGLRITPGIRRAAARRQALDHWTTEQMAKEGLVDVRCDSCGGPFGLVDHDDENEHYCSSECFLASLDVPSGATGVERVRGEREDQDVPNTKEQGT